MADEEVKKIKIGVDSKAAEKDMEKFAKKAESAIGGKVIKNRMVTDIVINEKRTLTLEQKEQRKSLLSGMFGFSTAEDRRRHKNYKQKGHEWYSKSNKRDKDKEIERIAGYFSLPYNDHVQDGKIDEKGAERSINKSAKDVKNYANYWKKSLLLEAKRTKELESLVEKDEEKKKSTEEHRKHLLEEAAKQSKASWFIGRILKDVLKFWLRWRPGTGFYGGMQGFDIANKFQEMKSFLKENQVKYSKGKVSWKGPAARELEGMDEEDDDEEEDDSSRRDGKRKKKGKKKKGTKKTGGKMKAGTPKGSALGGGMAGVGTAVGMAALAVAAYAIFKVVNKIWKLMKKTDAYRMGKDIATGGIQALFAYITILVFEWLEKVKLIKGIWNGMVAIWRWISGLFIKTGNTLSSIVDEITKQYDSAEKKFTTFKEGWNEFWDNLQTTVSDWIVGQVESAIKQIGNLFTGENGIVAKAVNAQASLIGIINAIPGPFQTVFNTLMNTAKWVFTNIGWFIIDVYNKIADSVVGQSFGLQRMTGGRDEYNDKKKHYQDIARYELTKLIWHYQKFGAVTKEMIDRFKEVSEAIALATAKAAGDQDIVDFWGY